MQPRRRNGILERRDPTLKHASCGVRFIFIYYSTDRKSYSCRNPPGAQGSLPRFSLVYFTRPNSSVLLRALTNESSMIAEAVKSASNPKDFDPGPGVTAAEWVTRRSRNRRAANANSVELLQGADQWVAGTKGTERL